MKSRPNPIKNPRRRDTIFVLLSLLVHATAILLLTTKARPPESPTKVEVEYLTPDAAPAREDSVKATRVKKQIRDQVVEQNKRINEEKDEATRLLSAFDQKVLKQTRAEQSGKFKNTAQKGHTSDGAKDGQKKAQADTPKEPRERGDLPDLKDLSPKFSLVPGPKTTVPDENGDASQTDDYLKDVQSGLQTLLSTREFVYYSYYSRIKESLRQHWEPTVREKVKIIYRKGRTIASAKDRVTQVLVILNSTGELIRVDMVSRSGVEALDDAAVEAFKDAAPFPNPPKGMVEKDGTIKIRWDFVLEARYGEGDFESIAS